MKTKTRQAVVWGRFSSAKQEDGDSRDRQERLNRGMAKREGIAIIAEYFDESMSVKEGATKLFEKVLSNLPKGVGIICENLDRISRGHPWRAKAYIADILEAGHFIITSQDGREYNAETIEELDTMVMGDMATNLARAENIKRAKRVNEARETFYALARQGKAAPLGAWLPAHVRYDFDTNQYRIVEANRQIIQRIFDEYVSGKGCSNIARGLNDDGIATFRRKKVKGWLGGVVSQILRCEGMVGTLIINGERIPNAFPPAVKEDLFYKVQSMFKANKARHGNYAAENINNILRGVCRCAHCGNSMKIYIGYGGVKRIQCGGYRVNKCTQKNMLQFPEVEFEFAKWFVPHAEKALLGNDENSTRIETLETKRAAIQKRIENTLALLDEGIAVKEVKERLAKLETERQGVDNMLAEARTKQSAKKAHPDTFKELASLIDGVLDNQETRKRVAALIPQIVERVDMDLSEKLFPSFTCTLVNGQKIQWQYDVMEFKQEILGISKDGQFVLGSPKVTEGAFKRKAA
jgi:DNA invertase Pin-like site-specific DNA recombinase